MCSTIIKRVVLIMLISLTMHSTASADTKDAASFINDLAARVIDIVKKTDVSEREKEVELTKIFLKTVDTKWIAKFAMGRYWRALTPNQQNQYVDLYSNYLTGLYVPNFRKYTGNVVKVLASTEIRPNEYIVQTELTDQTNSMNIKINYYLTQKDKGLENFSILDVIAEGVSLITTQRAEINSTMEQGDFNALVALLIKKTGSIDK